MVDKVNEEVKDREKKRNGKLINSFVVLSIVLSVLAASIVMVSADGPVPPEITNIIATADPPSIPADGESVSDINASTEWSDGAISGWWIHFEIINQPGGTSLTEDWDQTDSAGKAYTQLIAGTNAGNVVIKVSAEGAGWYVENFTNVTLLPPPTIIPWNNKTRNNSLSVTINESECVYFNATADQPINVWRWFVNDSNQSRNFDNFTYCGWSRNGTYNVKVNATNANGTSNTITWTVTVKDIKPPASITILANTTGNFWINWTWANPPDADFNRTMVYINGSFVTNVTKPQNWYNATGAPHATRTISTRTVDTSGNINTTWVNQTATIPNNLPVWEAIGPKSGLVGQPLTIDANATDLDYTDVLIYSCNRTDLFADFNPATGKGNWTPPQTGIYYVDFGVSDGYGGIVNETVQITVFGYGVNLTVEGGKYAEKTTAPSVNATYLLTVKNTGTIADTYTLSVVENPNGADVALNRTTITNLAQGATADVLLNVSDAIDGTYIVNVTATGTGVSDKVTTKTTVSAMGSVTGKITYTHNITGIADVSVNLTQDGSVVASTTTDGAGNYTFNDVTPGDYYVNASKPTFWDNSTAVTVTGGATATADMMLWLKGDLNNDGFVNVVDIAMMRQAVAGLIDSEWYFDLNNDGSVNVVDLAMMRQAVAGLIILE